MVVEKMTWKDMLKEDSNPIRNKNDALNRIYKARKEFRHDSGDAAIANRLLDLLEKYIANMEHD
mgnify:CR=1 FL=1